MEADFRKRKWRAISSARSKTPHSARRQKRIRFSTKVLTIAVRKHITDSEVTDALPSMGCSEWGAPHFFFEISSTGAGLMC